MKTPIEPLDEHVVKFLLFGPGSAQHRAAQERIAALYKKGPRVWAEEWRQHETQLRAVAADKHWRPVHARHFFAEAVAIELAKRRR